MSNYLIKTILVFVGALFINACSLQEKKIISINGPLDARSYEVLRRADPSMTKYVVVTSGGGVPYYALRIAKRIKELDVPIKISGICASACLYILAIDNRKIEFIKPTLVLSHNSQLSTYLMSKRLYPLISNGHYLATSNEEAGWYSSNGIASNFAVVTQVALDTRCIIGPRTDRIEDAMKVYIASRMSAVSLSADELEYFGFDVRPSWRKYIVHSVNDLSVELPSVRSSRIRVGLGDNSSLTQEQAEALLVDLPRCTTTMVAEIAPQEEVADRQHTDLRQN